MVSLLARHYICHLIRAPTLSTSPSFPHPTMPPLPTYGKRPVVLLTVSWVEDEDQLTVQNDDGPPADHSPNIYLFSKLLREKLGWDVRVVVPDGQNSW